MYLIKEKAYNIAEGGKIKKKKRRRKKGIGLVAHYSTPFHVQTGCFMSPVKHESPVAPFYAEHVIPFFFFFRYGIV